MDTNANLSDKNQILYNCKGREKEGLYLINGKNYLSFDRSKSDGYWEEFFIYENSSFVGITEKELKEEIALEKFKAKPIIDSQQLTNTILTRLSKRFNFHHDFHEQFPSANAGSVLGMQLHILILRDEEDWCYIVPKHPSHMFAHATYFIPNKKRFVE